MGGNRQQSKEIRSPAQMYLLAIVLPLIGLASIPAAATVVGELQVSARSAEWRVFATCFLVGAVGGAVTMMIALKSRHAERARTSPMALVPIGGVIGFALIKLAPVRYAVIALGGLGGFSLTAMTFVSFFVVARARSVPLKSKSVW